MISYISIIGMVAAVSTTISFVPQVLKVWKEKSAKDISLLMYIIFCFGILSWLIYGLLIKDLPVILANAVTFILAGTVLYFKIKYR